MTNDGSHRTNEPNDIPERVGVKFSTLMRMNDNVALIHCRDKRTGKSRYLIFRVYPDGAEGSGMMLEAELIPDDIDRMRAVLDEVEPHPSSDMTWQVGRTPIPDAFKND